VHNLAGCNQHLVDCRLHFELKQIVVPIENRGALGRHTGIARDDFSNKKKQRPMRQLKKVIRDK
jgi:hypothetical protein